MILASCRRNFTSPWFESSLQLRDEDGIPITLERLALSLAKHNVCILVHGYRVDFDSAVAAYARIENMAKAEGLDYTFIGYLWPGSVIAAGFFAAISRATKSGFQLADLIWGLNDAGCKPSVETHSLGARVALKALALGADVKDVILTAPAVDDGSLALNAEFYRSLAHARRVGVFYSANDPVLKGAYWWAELLLERRQVHALGLDGPEKPTPFNVQSFDMSSQVHSHGEYRDRTETYQNWKAFIA